jgi:hypothetical protein
MKNYFIQNPKYIFVLDGVGALLSLLGLLLLFLFFQKEVGFSTGVFGVLLVAAMLLAAFDFFCYFKIEPPYQRHMLMLAMGNIAYIIFTAVGLFYHAQQVSVFAWSYFLLELVILMALVVLELQVAFVANTE